MKAYQDGEAMTEEVEILAVNRGRGLAIVQDAHGRTGVELLGDLYSPEYGWLE